MLSIARVFYPVTVLGPGNRVGIWIAGCRQNCKGCISPELRNEANGRLMSTKEIIGIIKTINCKIDGITISGGEPFLHPKDLYDLLLSLELFTEDIIVFTGLKYEELIEDKDSYNALRHISVLIDGEYDRKRKVDKGLRGSSNQQIIILKNPEKYSNLELCDRKIQNVLFGEKLLSIGIPKGE